MLIMRGEIRKQTLAAAELRSNDPNGIDILEEWEWRVEKMEKGGWSAGQGTEFLREVGGRAGYKKTKPPKWQ